MAPRKTVGKGEAAAALPEKPSWNASRVMDWMQLILVTTSVTAAVVFWPTAVPPILTALIGLAAIVFFCFAKDKILFRYLSRSLLIVLLTTIVVNGAASIDSEIEDYKLATIYIVFIKFLSLFFMFLDSMIGAQDIRPENKSHDPLLLIKFGAGFCFLSGGLILISLFRDVETWSATKLGMSSIDYTITVNIIALFPMVFFTINNVNIVYRKNRTVGKEILEICQNFLWYINIPTLVCSSTVFFLGIVMSMNGADAKSIEKIISGSILFLIFSAMMIGLAIENRMGYFSERD